MNKYLQYIFFSLLISFIFTQACRAASEFVTVIDPGMGSGYDYVSLSAWDGAIRTDLTASTTKVFSGLKTETISDNTTVYLCRSGVYQSVTANNRHATNSQILVQSISNGSYTFQVGDVWYTNNTCNSAGYFSLSSVGDSAIAVAKCRTTNGNADTTPVQIANWTTSPTNYIKIWADPSENYRHRGQWNSTKYRMEITDNHAIILNAGGSQLKDVVIDGLQIRITRTTAGANTAIDINSLPIGSTSDFTISNCILDGGHNTNNSGNGIYLQGQGTPTLRVYNNIIYGFDRVGFVNSCVRLNWASATAYVYNNTCANAYIYRGFYNEAGTYIAKNNISQNSYQDYYGTFDASSANNISEDNTSPNAGSMDCGGHSCRSQSVSFVDASGSTPNFHLQSSDTSAMNSGVDLSADSGLSFNTDIDRQSRSSASNWDIGADEYAMSDAFTVSGWVKMSGTSNVSKALVAKAEELRLTTDDSGRPRCQIKSGGSWQAAAVASTALNLNEWAHVACVYDKSTLKVYINGAEKDSDSLSVGVDNTSNHLKFGVDDSADGTYGDFQGFMDEVRIYPYARSAVQMAFDYNAGMSGLSAKKGAGVTFGNESEKWMSDGLVGYWRMDESSWNGTASEVTDASGNNNHGTASGGATTDVGKFGKGGVFDGVDDYVNVSNESNFDFERTDPFSMSAWVKYNTGGTVYYIYDKKPNSGYFPGISWGIDVINKRIRFYFTQDKAGGNVGGLTAVNTLSSGVWHHVAVTYDGSSSLSGLICYIDGAVSAHNGVATMDTTILNNTQPNIGRQLSGGGLYLNGLLDEFRIYDRKLSSDEVKSIYEWSTSPIAHMKMDEKVSGDGSILYDTSGYQRNATLEQGANGIGADCSVRGKYGSACQLDGTDDHLEINDFSY